MSRLKDKYLSEVVKGLQEKYNYKNVMELPKVRSEERRVGKEC